MLSTYLLNKQMFLLLFFSMCTSVSGFLYLDIKMNRIHKLANQVGSESAHCNSWVYFPTVSDHFCQCPNVQVCKSIQHLFYKPSSQLRVILLSFLSFYPQSCSGWGRLYRLSLQRDPQLWGRPFNPLVKSQSHPALSLAGEDDFNKLSVSTAEPRLKFWFLYVSNSSLPFHSG